jgi:tetratricopeptide (TPR) repeat protein
LSHQQSIPVFSQWIESDADFPLFYVARGFAYLNTGNLELALEDLSKPGQTEPQLTATLAAGRGLVLARMREIPRSSAEFGTALRLLPQSPVVEVFLGQTCVDQGKYIEAHKHFKKAANLAKKTPQYQDTLAFYLATREGDDPVSARQAMEHAASACRWTDWQEWQYLDTLAIACAATGDFKMAIQWGEKALGRAPAECQDSLRERLTLFAAKKPYKPQ